MTKRKLALYKKKQTRRQLMKWLNHILDIEFERRKRLESERVRAKFLDKLAKQRPDHPWVA
jgi:hypothetical protein